MENPSIFKAIREVPTIASVIAAADASTVRFCTYSISLIIAEGEAFSKGHARDFISKFSPLCNPEHPLRIRANQEGATDLDNIPGFLARGILAEHTATVLIAFDFMNRKLRIPATLSADDLKELAKDYTDTKRIADRLAETIVRGPARS